MSVDYNIYKVDLKGYAAWAASMNDVDMDDEDAYEEALEAKEDVTEKACQILS